MNAVIIQEPCRMLQNDESKFYYALSVDGRTFRMSEAAYPGNEKAAILFAEIAEKLNH